MEFIINYFELKVDKNFVLNLQYNNDDKLLYSCLMNKKTYEPDYEKLAVICIIKKQWETVFNEEFENLIIKFNKCELDNSEIELEKNKNDLSNKIGLNYLKLFAVGVVSENLIGAFQKHRNNIISNTDFMEDFDFNYMALMSLNNSYFLNMFNKDLNDSNIVLECPQLMYWRIALQIHSTRNEELFCNYSNKEWNNILNTYKMLKNKQILHSSPTLFNSGTVKNQLSSCFLKFLEEDSIEGIYRTMTECAKISQHAGGIGLCLSSIRSKYSIIKSTQKHTQGVIQLLEQYEHLINYVNQSGRRSGAMCVYFEMTHPEIDDIIESAKHFNKLKIGLWIPDIFMERVKSNSVYSLFDGKYHRNLIELYGEKYRKLYLEYEEDGKYVRQINAVDLYNIILATQVERGHPFMCFKDTANELSNQQNIGTIKSSNLCTEIFEVTDEETTAVCNLANINLEDCTIEVSDKLIVDYKQISKRVKTLVRNLNNIIDENYYCCDYSEKSNKTTRPIGIGVTGLQGLFFKLKISLTSDLARIINKHIFECMYYYALKESNKISKENTLPIIQKLIDSPVGDYFKYFSGSYKYFKGSPLSEGITHIDLYEKLTNRKVATTYDWETLKHNIKLYGVCNSLFIALMPSVKTSILMDSTESFEPLESMLTNRNTQDGLFNQLNKYVIQILKEKGEYNKTTIDSIIKYNGSIQHLKCLSPEEKQVFRTSWEIPMQDYINTCIDRAPYVDQSQSMSLYMSGKVDLVELGRLHMYSWNNKLKTGCYYLNCLNTNVNQLPECNPECSGCG
jgi:ribonucleotide reductase alpha subunit